MVAEYTDELVGKSVVSQSGGTVGTVDYVKEGAIYVQIEQDVDAEVLRELGWDGVVNREDRELEGEYISTITDETIRLRI